MKNIVLKIKQKVCESLLLQMGIFAAIIALLLMTACLKTVQTADRAVLENVLSFNEKIMLQVQDKVENYLESSEDMITAMAYSPSVYKSFTQAPLERFLNQENVNNTLSGLMLAEESVAGVHFYDSNLVYIGGLGVRFEESKEVERLCSETELSELFSLDEKGTLYYLISLPVFDIEKKTLDAQIGMCCVLMRAEKFSELLDETNVTQRTEVYLIDKEGVIAGAGNSNPGGQMTAKMMRPDSDFEVQVLELSLPGWRLVTRISKEEIYESIFEEVRAVIIPAFAAAFVLVLVVMLFCYRKAKAPQQRMSIFIKNLVKNDTQL